MLGLIFLSHLEPTIPDFCVPFDSLQILDVGNDFSLFPIYWLKL